MSKATVFQPAMDSLNRDLKRLNEGLNAHLDRAGRAIERFLRDLTGIEELRKISMSAPELPEPVCQEDFLQN